jgi:hypothetical protein
MSSSRLPSGLSVDAPAAARQYLAALDRRLSRRVVGFYLSGSFALGGYRPGRSDIDFVAVMDRRLGFGELRCLRRLHVTAGVANAARAMAHGHSPTTGTTNGVFVDAGDLGRPVGDIVPIASQSGHIFEVGAAFDVNPVMWKVLGDHGVVLRGTAPDRLGLDVRPDVVRGWTRGNLESYWRPWALAARAHPGASWRLHPRWLTTWGVLGVSRLHRTIASGEIVTKEAAGEHARRSFDPSWHPIIDDAIAYRQGRPAPAAGCVGGLGPGVPAVERGWRPAPGGRDRRSAGGDGRRSAGGDGRRSAGGTAGPRRTGRGPRIGPGARPTSCCMSSMPPSLSDDGRGSGAGPP